MIRFVHIAAPFGAFRPMTAGWYRPTATMLTPSAAYGLLLNFAAIDSRVIETDTAHDGKTPASLTRTGLPPAKIAIGVGTAEQAHATRFPVVQTVLQQLHNYPVGASAGVDKEWTKGNKNNISPVRREFLSDLNLTIALDADKDFCDRIDSGLKGEFNDSRYGLPFLGDNSFLIDSVEVDDETLPCNWYEAVDRQQSTKSRHRHSATRLTINIDRRGVANTKSSVFVPTEKATSEPPVGAWVEVG